MTCVLCGFLPRVLTDRESCLNNALVDRNVLEFGHHLREVGVVSCHQNYAVFV